MKNVATLTLITLLTAGCAATANDQAPTHRWASASVANEVEYRNDHARCQAQANIGSSEKELDSNSEAFTAYKQCMTSRGYELTAYRD